jgi:uncharacterized protein YegJ (DUF2314 family)
MHIDPGIFVGLAIGIAVWLFLRWRSPRPDFPPLSTSHDDPLMLEALEKARTGIAQFLRLIHEPRESALVKLRFVSSSKQVEHLWAELLEVFSDQEFGVRLITPPVTHSGKLDRLYRCKIEDVEDWQVRDIQGRLFGGFTQRAMLTIAHRDGVKLPKQLLELEREYKDA